MVSIGLFFNLFGDDIFITMTILDNDSFSLFADQRYCPVLLKC